MIGASAEPWDDHDQKVAIKQHNKYATCYFKETHRVLAEISPCALAGLTVACAIPTVERKALVRTMAWEVKNIRQKSSG
jgi:hypothetical protein